eukprot:g18606.t2
MVCLEECEDVIGSTWLHPRPSTPVDVEDVSMKEVDACEVSACAACLKTYFTGIVEAGFDGACPRMRCVCCTRVVCERAWAPLVEPDVLETFRARAATLLSIQCGSCHSRGTIMVEPPANHSYSSAVEALMVEAAKALDNATGSNKPTCVDEAEKTRDGTLVTPTSAAATNMVATIAASPTTGAAAVASIDTTVNSNGKTENKIASSARNAKLQESLRAELELYMSGDQVDASPCYLAFEAVFSNPETPKKDQESRNSLMRMLMNCIEDSERRASMHVRFIRSNPMVTTECCQAEHCFRCRVFGGHAPHNCQQYEAQRSYEDVIQCPGCGVYVVKGDGCDAITCICGYDFDWSVLVHNRLAETFRDAYPDDTERLAAEIIRRGPPTVGTEGVEQAPRTAVTDSADPAAGRNVTAGANVCNDADGEEELDASEETARIQSTSPPSQSDGTVGQEGLAQQPASTPGADDAGRSGWATMTEEEDIGGSGPRHVRAHGWGEGPASEPTQALADGWDLAAPAPETGQVWEGGWGDEVPAREQAIPTGDGPLSAENDFRMAHAYAQAHPVEVRRARAEIYGEDNPHFTVQRARFQQSRSTLEPALVRYTGRAHRAASPPSDAEAEWQATASAAWLTENTTEVSAVEQIEAAARLSLVEAFYGDEARPQHNTAITHTAAEHARAALRVATPLESPLAPATNGYSPEEDKSLFEWLGIFEPPPPVPPGDGNGSSLDGEVAAEDADEDRMLPTSECDMGQPVLEAIPAPSLLWTPWPRGNLAPSRPRIGGRIAPPDPATRVVSTVETFGSLRIKKEVELWVAGTGARQERLRALMAIEERELSKAWVALWGRRLRLDPSSKAWVDENGDDDAALRSAARRVVFLEGHPEQACREQAAMMKAFVRRNGAAVARAKEESKAELATAWEKLHATEFSLPSTARAAEVTTSTSISTLNQAYEAYLRYVEANNPTVPASRSKSPIPTTPRSLDLRLTGRMADAWVSKNRSWVSARRFADRFPDSNANNDHNTADASAATTAAVVALVVAPTLLRRSSLMCDCGMGSVINDAVDWVSFNQEAFEKEFDRLYKAMSAGGGEASGECFSRAIEGCECPQRELSVCCAGFMACPVVTRRILKVPEPVCTACEECDDFLDGDLLDLFS